MIAETFHSPDQKPNLTSKEVKKMRQRGIDKLRKKYGIHEGVTDTQIWKKQGEIQDIHKKVVEEVEGPVIKKEEKLLGKLYTNAQKNDFSLMDTMDEFHAQTDIKAESDMAKKRTDGIDNIFHVKS
ncbi:hypothetical protein COB57_02230 [Candidatus Peregrinibacteria bacterium]|nr:MAG: hypothetical protein COB57_02230 [Candidatus Peregrinibacteria bacterium]